MKNKIIFLLIILVFISCKKEEKNDKDKVKIVIERPKIEMLQKETEEEKQAEKEEMDSRENPLKKYVTDEVYREGRKIFYEKEQYMFTVDKSQFCGNLENLNGEITSKFRVGMLMSHQGKQSAIVYYKNGEQETRTIINGSKIITVGEVNYYIKALKDRVEIRKGESGFTIPLYSRGR